MGQIHFKKRATKLDLVDQARDCCDNIATVAAFLASARTAAREMLGQVPAPGSRTDKKSGTTVEGAKIVVRVPTRRQGHRWSVLWGERPSTEGITARGPRPLISY